MSLVKYAGVSLIAMSASMGHAGGMEATALSAGFMFEDGSYGSVSVQSQSPSVKATMGWSFYYLWFRGWQCYVHKYKSKDGRSR